MKKVNDDKIMGCTMLLPAIDGLLLEKVFFNKDDAYSDKVIVPLTDSDAPTVATQINGMAVSANRLIFLIAHYVMNTELGIPSINLDLMDDHIKRKFLNELGGTIMKKVVGFICTQMNKNLTLGYQPTELTDQLRQDIISGPRYSMQDLDNLIDVISINTAECNPQSDYKYH